MRRALLLGLCLALTTASCFRQTATRSDEHAAGPRIHVPLLFDPDDYVSAALTIQPPDAGTLRFSEARIVDGGFVARQLATGRWFFGRGPYVFAVVYEKVDGGVGDELRHLVELSGAEKAIEGDVTLFGSVLPPEFELTVVDGPPPTLKVEEFSRSPEWAAASFRMTNTSETDSFFFQGPTPEVRVDRNDEAQRWSPVEPAAICQNPFTRDEATLSPDASLQFDSREQACRLKPMTPGHYRFVFRLDRQPFRYGEEPPVKRVVEVVSEFDARSSTDLSPTHLFPDVPAAALRQLPPGLTVFELDAGQQLGAVVVAPDGGSACACVGSRIGSEGHIAVSGAGEICLAPEANLSVKSCKPLRQFYPVRNGSDQLPPDLLPPYPYEKKKLP